MRVDGHVHVWDLAVREQPWTASLPALRRSFGLADLGPSLDAHGIDAVVLVQTVCVPEETPELLSLAATHGEAGTAAHDEGRTVRLLLEGRAGSRPSATGRVAGVVGWVDLCAADVGARLRSLRAGAGGAALVGIRHQVQEEDDPRWLCRPDVRRGLGAVAEAGLVYELLVRPPQLASVIETVAALPELRFVLDHGAKPDVSAPVSDEWRRAIRALARHDNLVAKLSGLTSEAGGTDWTVESLRPFARTLMEEFGPERLMFGSDWPVCRLGGGYDATIAATEAWLAEWGPDERSLVFGGVAERVYGLGATRR
ncbi:MAG TPA: amidohydrolase family protein [Solirubrobacteraceae bacterium]|nr:amidohydrolase family protein [Solirubrobacteraceae bacterium]